MSGCALPWLSKKVAFIDSEYFVPSLKTCGYHFENAQLDRDFKVDEFGDFRFILEGEPLSDGSGNAQFAEEIIPLSSWCCSTIALNVLDTPIP
jgi:hypothetical protein